MIREDDLILYMERALNNGKAYVPRICFYQCNLRKMKRRELEDIIALLDAAKNQIRGYIKDESV